eukprot:TRINITY_DN1611_c0_g1_i2.p1 TRINITY_DN1611_c0_g1~~TRINITY_DN1611_c0_g1_i2.p1  ORF type:complete len:130 (-),score=23.41 TRINITY_DN1611_c0_g1_i2:186-575(-)
MYNISHIPEDNNYRPSFRFTLTRPPSAPLSPPPNRQYQNNQNFVSYGYHQHHHHHYQQYSNESVEGTYSSSDYHYNEDMDRIDTMNSDDIEFYPFATAERYLSDDFEIDFASYPSESEYLISLEEDSFV